VKENMSRKIKHLPLNKFFGNIGNENSLMVESFDRNVHDSTPDVIPRRYHIRVFIRNFRTQYNFHFQFHTIE